jgi:hypothetical protein
MCAGTISAEPVIFEHDLDHALGKIMPEMRQRRKVGQHLPPEQDHGKTKS